MKILIALLTALALAGCTVFDKEATDTVVTKEQLDEMSSANDLVQFPGRPGVFIGSLLAKKAYYLDIGDSGWIDERKVIVYPGDRCAVVDDVEVYPEYDAAHRLRLTLNPGVKYSLEVPEGIRDLHCARSDTQMLTKAELKARIIIDAMSVIVK